MRTKIFRKNAQNGQKLAKMAQKMLKMVKKNKKIVRIFEKKNPCIPIGEIFFENFQAVMSKIFRPLRYGLLR